MDRPTL